MDVNVLALCLATQLSIQSMEKTGIDGIIININSISSNHVPNLPNNVSRSAYTPSKFAVTALSEALRKELVNRESRIKVSVRKIT